MTTPQQQRALDIGNRVRTTNGRTQQDVRALPSAKGAKRAAALLRDVPDPLGALPITALLRAVRGIGEAKSGEMLQAAGVWRTNRRIRDLSPRQRELLAAGLVEWGGRQVTPAGDRELAA